MAKYVVPDTVNLSSLKKVTPPKQVVPPKQTVQPSQVVQPPKQVVQPQIQPKIVVPTPTPVKAFVPPSTPTPPVAKGPSIQVRKGFVKLENNDLPLTLDGRALYSYHHMRNGMMEFVREVAGYRFLETKDLLRSGDEDELRVLSELAKYGVDPRNPDKEFANISNTTMAELTKIRQLMDEFKLSAEDAIAAYRFATKQAHEKTNAIIDWLKLTNQVQMQILAPSLNSAINKASSDVAALRRVPNSETLLWDLISGERKHEFAQLVAKVLEEITVSRQGAYNVTNAQVVRVKKEYQQLLFSLRA